MTPEELAAARERLEELAAEVLAPLRRSDQRGKGQTYLRGLLLDGRRKSMQPMAERLGVDHQLARHLRGAGPESAVHGGKAAGRGRA